MLVRFRRKVLNGLNSSWTELANPLQERQAPLIACGNFALPDSDFLISFSLTLITMRYHPFGFRQIVSFAELARQSNWAS
jgi:hypothetical protein